MSHPFLERLSRGPILADGAMGTCLYSQGASFKQSFEELNLSNPKLVAEVHDQYIEAGAELIETNSYGANRRKLLQYGLGNRVREVNIKAVKIARERREIAGKELFIAGSIGPIGKYIDKMGGVAAAEARGWFSEQVEGLLEGGVDLFVVETMSDVEELCIAVEVIRESCELPVIGQVTISDDLSTLSGNSPQEVLAAARELELDVVGGNCSVGPQRLFDFLSILHSGTTQYLSALPNAGLPRYVEGRFFYVSSPGYFAEYCRKFLNLGVSIIGGCCGTTPEHIKAMREVFDSFKKMSTDQPAVEVFEPTRQEKHTKSRVAVSNFAAKLGKEFVVSVEIDPPRGANPDKVLRAAKKLINHGVDAINVADSPMAKVRMSCLATSALIMKEVGAEIILHYTSRDRNLMGLQSDLIGAHALGIRNILAVTGDPPSMGDYPNATAVYDVDSIGLVEIISRLNAGTDLAGNSIGSNTQFSIGVALNPATDDFERELQRLYMKIEAGAQFAMTQPLYKLDILEKFLNALKGVKIPVLLGLLPLQSYRHAEFLHNEVPGIDIPENTREQLRKAGKDGAKCGVKMCRQLYHESKDLVEGVYLMPSFGRYETVLQVLE